MAEQEETWALYEEYSSTLDSLSTEDWISFRYYMYIHLYRWLCLWIDSVLCGGHIVHDKILANRKQRTEDEIYVRQ